MTAYIPHKDTLFLLAQMQKNIIRAHNDKQPEDFLFPQYPLFAFHDDAEIAKCTKDEKGKGLESAGILSPKADGCEMYFPLVLKYADGTQDNLRIIFATSKQPIRLVKARFAQGLDSAVFGFHNYKPEIKKAPEFNSDAFPLQLRIFRKARAVLECNSWQIFDEKWVKL